MDQKTVFIRMSLQSWQTQVDRASKFINDITDEQFLKEIAPSKNRVIYLVGHLAAIHDLMPEILGMGKRAHPGLHAAFVESPDKAVEKIPSAAELRQIWISVHERLKDEFPRMPADGWFNRHESMSDADFEKDPTRNKLNVLLNRTNHLSYHLGQLRLLK
jgi:hypothetical protein